MTRRALCLYEWEQIELDLYSAIERCWCDYTIKIADRAVLSRLVCFTYGMMRTEFTARLADILDGVDEDGRTIARPTRINVESAKRSVQRLHDLGVITRTWRGHTPHFCLHADVILERGHAMLGAHKRFRARVLKSMQGE